MIIAKYYLDVRSLQKIPKLIKRFPETIRPTHFGHSEKKNDPRFPLSSTNAVETLEQLTNSGYILFCRDITYNLIPPIRSYGELFVSSGQEVLGADDLKDLTQLLTEPGFEFGFIAECEEYIHRNRYVYRLPNGTVESWVGRDLAKHLPGLYWTTVLETNLAEKCGLYKETWPWPVKTLDFGSKYFGLQLFDQPNNWGEYAPKIDAFCEQNEPIFSIERVRQQLETARNYLEFVRLVKKLA
jgi:hypothetical protein